MSSVQVKEIIVLDISVFLRITAAIEIYFLYTSVKVILQLSFQLNQNSCRKTSIVKALVKIIKRVGHRSSQTLKVVDFTQHIYERQGIGKAKFSTIILTIKSRCYFITLKIYLNVHFINLNPGEIN